MLQSNEHSYIVLRRCLRVLALLTLVVHTGLGLMAQNTSTAGREFFLVFQENYQGEAPTLYASVSGQPGTTGRIRGLDGGFTMVFTIPASGVETITVPSSYRNLGSNIISSRVLLLTASSDVSVYSTNFLEFSTDASIVLPLPALGSRYIVTAGGTVFRMQFAVFAADEPVTVRITPTVNLDGGRAAGVPFNIQLQAGQVIQFKSGDDVSGTIVEAVETSARCPRFGVVAGNECGRIGPVCCCNHIYEQLYPVASWGTEYVGFLPQTTPIVQYLIIAAENGTNVVAGTQTFSLNAGQTRRIDDVSASFLVRANRPISVTQFGYGGSPAVPSYDPFMLCLSPTQQALKRIRFNTLPFAANKDPRYHCTIVTPTVNTGNVLFDGQAVVGFVRVNGDPALSIARINTTAGVHDIVDNGTGVVAYVYAYSNSDAYGYSAGASANDLRTQIELLGMAADSTFCPGQTVRLRGWNTDTLSVRSWSWIFHDGTRASGRNVEKRYEVDGDYSVTLIVESDRACTDDTVIATIRVRSRLLVEMPRYLEVCVGAIGTAEIFLAAGGTAPYVHRWRALQAEGEMLDSVVNRVQRFRFAASGEYRYEVTTTDASECTRRDTLTIVAFPLPRVTVNQLTEVCAEVPLSIRASADSGRAPYRFSWQALDESGITSGDSTQELRIVHAREGRYRYRVNVLDAAGCAADSTVEVLVRPLPEVNAGPGKVIICIGDTAQLGREADGAGIVGGTPPYRRIQWTVVRGTAGSVVTPTALETQVIPRTTTLYQVTVEDSLGCIGTDTVTVDVRMIPDANAGDDVSICECDRPDPQRTIGVASRCGVGPFRYSWSPAAGLSATDAVPVRVNPTSTTTYTLTVTDDGTGVTSTDEVLVAVHPCPSITLTSAITKCGPAAPFQLEPGISTVAEAGTRYEWSPSTFLDDSTKRSPIVSLPDDNVTIDYTLRIRDGNSCPAEATTRIRTAKTLQISIEYADTACVCRNDSVRLPSRVQGGIGPYTYVWTPSTFLDDPTSESPIARPLADVRYVVTVTDSLGCTSTDTVSICTLPVPFARPGDSIVMCEGDPAVAAPGADVALCGVEPFTYAWTPTAGVSDPTSPTPRFAPAETTTYQLTVRDAGGAQTTAILQVTVNLLPRRTVRLDKASYCPSDTIRISTMPVTTEPMTIAWIVDSVVEGVSDSLVLPTIPLTRSVTMRLRSESGCIYEEVIPIRVAELPELSIDDAFVCPCDSVELKVNVNGGVPGYTFAWSGANGDSAQYLSSTTTARVIASPPTTTDYIVDVRDRDGSGCLQRVGTTVVVGDAMTTVDLIAPTISVDARAQIVALPIVLSSEWPSLRCPPRGLTFKLAYDQRLFDPFPTATVGNIIDNTVDSNRRTLTIELTAEELTGLSQGDVVTSLTGAPLLGDPGQTLLRLHDVVWKCVNLETADHEGSLALDSLCLESGRRLLSFGAGPEIVSVVPNPVKTDGYVTLRRFHGEQVDVAVYTAQGQLVYQEEWPAAPVRSDQGANELRTIPIRVATGPGTYALVANSTFGSSTYVMLVLR